MQSDWLKSGRMMWFVQGNFVKEEAIEIVEKVRDILKLKPVSKDMLSTVRHLNI